MSIRWLRRLSQFSRGRAGGLSRPRQTVLVLAVLALAAFNLTFRLGSESLTEWDESLYASSALDMLVGGHPVATTILGELDYYNSKPPLAAWLIAGSMHLFGESLLAIRLPAVLSAWATVVVVLIWGWRRMGFAAGLFAALVLSTSFGFLYIHSGRSANPDAPLTLLLLLVVVVLDTSARRPWVRVWLGPLLACVFLLKGPAVLLPLLLVAIVEIHRRIPSPRRWQPLLFAGALAAAPITAWVVARWRVDGLLFFKSMFDQDLIGVTTRVLDDHSGSATFYLNVLLKHHYEWLFAAIAVALLYPPQSWRVYSRKVAFWRSTNHFVVVAGWWIVVALAVPSLMQTKLPWYVNPLYPMFALAVGAALRYGFSRTPSPAHHRPLLATMVIVAAVVAEGKLLAYSYHYRGIEHSMQGVLIAAAPRVAGSRVYSVTAWPIADTLVARGVAHANAIEFSTLEEFLDRTAPCEFVVLPAHSAHPALVEVAFKGDYGLYARATDLH